MAIYIVRMEHPAGDLWNKHVLEHAPYVEKLIAQGRLLAFGSLKQTPLRVGLLIMRARIARKSSRWSRAIHFTSKSDLRAYDRGVGSAVGMLIEQSSKQPPPELASLF